MKYLALDMGSSFIKYSVLDTTKRTIGEIIRVSVPEPCIHNETRHEISAEAIWHGVKNIIAQVAEKEKELKGIVLCTQMHGFLLANDCGEAVTPYISWQDRRCLESDGGICALEQLKQSGCQEEMQNAGVHLQPNISMCNLYALLQERNFTEEQIHFCTLGSYLIWRMTGNHICHITNGAPTGLVDIVEGRWNHKLINRLGFEGIQFPQLSLGLESCGIYRLGGRELEVFPDFGDHQTCVLGCQIREKKDVIISVGTAGLLSVVMDCYQSVEGEVRPYFEGQYLYTRRGLFGGRDLGVLTDFVVDTVETVTGEEKMANNVWGVFTHDRENTEPVESSLKIKPNFFENGEITGITMNNFTLSRLVEAVYRCAAVEYHKALRAILSKTVAIDRIVYSGGAVRKNQWLKRRIAEELGYEWEDSPVEDESILGLFRIALVCSGSCENFDDTLICNQE